MANVTGVEEEFGAGLETETTASEPSVVLREAFATRFDLPDEITDDDKLTDYISQMQARANLISDDLANEETLRLMRENAARYAQVAPQLTEFQRWQAEQQAKTNTPPEPELPWKFRKIDQSGLTYDATSGRYAAPEGRPDLIRRADEANATLDEQRRFSQEFVSNPLDVLKTLLRSELEAREKANAAKLAEIEAKVNPIQEHAAIAALEKFEAPHASYLFADASKTTLTKGGELYDLLRSQGMAPSEALTKAQSLIPPAPKKTEQTRVPFVQPILDRKNGRVPQGTERAESRFAADDEFRPSWEAVGRVLRTSN